MYPSYENVHIKKKSNLKGDFFVEKNDQTEL